VRLAGVSGRLHILVGSRCPMEIDDRPEWTYLHRWSLAKPADGREEHYHLGDALVGICGDGWGSPRVETAWLSGRALAHALLERL